MSETVQQSSVPGDLLIPGGDDVSGGETSVRNLSRGNCTNIWTLGVGSEEIRSNRFEPFSLLFWHVTNLEAFSTCLEPKYLSSRIFWIFWFKSVLVLATCSKITQRCKNTFRKHFATHKKRSIGNEEYASSNRMRVEQHFERVDHFMTVCEQSTGYVT